MSTPAAVQSPVSSAASAPKVGAAEVSAGRFYQPELDVLRFFAFFGVFLFHAFPHSLNFYDANSIPRWLSAAIIPTTIAGAYGVDLFFALSAYLITGLLLRERASTGRLDLGGFYLRRILRIWPLYLSFVAMAAMVSFFTPPEKLAWHFIAGYSLLAGNWVYVIYGLPTGFTIPLWTVSIEEQFYLTWPLAVRRASVKSMAYIACGVLILANGVRVWLALSGAPLQSMEYNTFTRLDPMALGILLALVGSRLPRWTPWQRIVLLAGGVMSWIAASAFYGWNNPEEQETWRLAFTHPVIALGSLAILMAFLGAQHSAMKNPALIYLGKISYGLYVVHLLGLMWAARLLHPSTTLGVLAQLVVGFLFTLGLAAASYRWLESPFLRLKERFAHVLSRPV